MTRNGIYPAAFFEFHKDSNATVTTQNSCNVYPSALGVRKYQRCFPSSDSLNFKLSNLYRAERPSVMAC